MSREHYHTEKSDLSSEIARRKQVEAELEKVLAENRALLRAMPDVVCGVEGSFA